MFGVGVINGDDGVGKHSLFRHGAQTNHTGGRFFGAANHIRKFGFALGVQDGDQVRPVIHGELGLVVDRRHDVRVIAVVVLAFDGEDGNVVIAYEAGGHIILGGERVGGAEGNVGSAVAGADHQVRGFSGDVQAG